MISEEYIDPDKLWVADDEAVAFIYQVGHPIMYGDPGATHEDIISRVLGVGDGWDEGHDHAFQEVQAAREEYEHDHLFGRVGWYYDKPIVSIWQNDERLLNYNLESCIQQLLKDKMIVKSTTIHTPRGISSVDDPLNHTEDNNVSDEDLELLKQLHLMPPEQKKAALMQMGAVGGRKHQWQQASEQSGLVTPGQKWWAATSEAYLRFCRSAS